MIVIMMILYSVMRIVLFFLLELNLNILCIVIILRRHYENLIILLLCDQYYHLPIIIHLLVLPVPMVNLRHRGYCINFYRRFFLLIPLIIMCGLLAILMCHYLRLS